MRKKIIRFVLMLVMLAAIPMSVSAEDFKGKDGWKVSFDGDKMDSTFDTLNIKGNLAQGVEVDYDGKAETTLNINIGASVCLGRRSTSTVPCLRVGPR